MHCVRFDTREVLHQCDCKENLVLYDAKLCEVVIEVQAVFEKANWTKCMSISLSTILKLEMFGQELQSVLDPAVIINSSPLRGAVNLSQCSEFIR